MHEFKRIFLPAETITKEVEYLTDLANRLDERARIRRQIPTRRSVQEGAADRLSDQLEAAANAIRFLMRQNPNYPKEQFAVAYGSWTPPHHNGEWVCPACKSVGTIRAQYVYKGQYGGSFGCTSCKIHGIADPMLNDWECFTYTSGCSGVKSEE